MPTGVIDEGKGFGFNRPIIFLIFVGLVSFSEFIINR